MEYSLNPSRKLTRRSLLNIVSVDTKETKCPKIKDNSCSFRQISHGGHDSYNASIYVGLVCKTHSSYCELNNPNKN